ncbi:Probable cobalt transporter subunit (CbtB) [Jatrophihabitans endophyticus]|uniref:Probable cobalt transporter subunit (CbtB) n=1 Tax=Jatrophihabitans endophyticus TaxID=1206085 RepID=A0A1M5Q8A1_9ACTN|nr:CbtB-domain containing protein [Jatrophihabitans endophyticus]SHH09693.1 Probable cobalt transporter subunit (CbtB) [Jatrophihabitans endophyticus]
MSSTHAPTTAATPVVVSLPKAGLQLAAVVLFALLAYYFVGVDQGMTSVFGDNTAVHEFVHDARHFLGFPCH